MIAEPLYLRGALVAYPPRASLLSKHLAYLPFRFNPESISRTLSAAQGPQHMSAGGNTDITASSSDKGASSPNAPNGAFTESFSLKLRFDVHEREQTASLLPPALGIAPELAVLETFLAPVASDKSRVSKGEHAAMPETPTLVLVWGARVSPVRLTSLRIDETLYNAFLNPVRAEVEASFTVVSSADASQGKFIKGIHDAMAIKRQALAYSFMANTAAQGGGILPL